METRDKLVKDLAILSWLVKKLCKGGASVPGWADMRSDEAVILTLEYPGLQIEWTDGRRWKSGERVDQ